MELKKDEITSKLLKKEKKVQITRTIIENYDLKEYLATITKFDMTMDSLHAQIDEQDRMQQSLMGNGTYKEAQALNEENGKNTD